jgi:teichuronic acid biosynthesis glycosyltransferase TuaH
MDVKLNSQSYWDERFSGDWDANSGPEQSRFFARVALGALPSWFLDQMRREKASLVDWGCAEGDGTELWSRYLEPSQITGIDFSERAIETAKARYPGVGFRAEDWISGADFSSSVFDVVFTSNTLEHFHDPIAVLDVLGRHARRAVIVVVPFEEGDPRHIEHHFTFTEENTPADFGDRFSLLWCNVVDCESIEFTRWSGKQFIAVFADNDWRHQLRLTLSHLRGARSGAASVEEVISSLRERVDEMENNIYERLRELEEANAGLAANIGHIAMEASVAASVDCLDAASSDAEIVSAPMLLGNTSATQNGNDTPELARRGIYQVARSAYWRLPIGLRARLSPIARRLRSAIQPNRAVSAGARGRLGDLSWEQFDHNVLRHRDAYKGIFIQDLIIDWNVPLFQRPQHIATAFGKLGYLVIYTTVNWGGDDVDGFRQVAPNVWLTNVDVIPRIKDAVSSIYSTGYATADRIIEKGIKARCLVYEYIDHIDPKISGDADNIRRLQSLKDFAFGGGADFIVASSDVLAQEAIEAVGQDKVIVVKNGVDTSHYRRARAASEEAGVEFRDFRKRYKKLVGYFGALAPWLWYDLINEVIAESPDTGFVFIGPDYYGGADRLAKGDNVLQTGPIDYQALPLYARDFDVCIIPFEPGEIARTTSPLKLFEYFALEKPVVVASDMHECTLHEEVLSGGNVAEFMAALEKAFAMKDDAQFKARLAKLADENDWKSRAADYAKVFEGL